MTESQIKDHHFVYRRVPNRKRTWNADIDKPRNEAFHNSEHGDELPTVSVDWSGRCDPVATRDRALDCQPEECFVVALPVGLIRALDERSQTVVYDPIPENDAHAGIVGPKQKKDFQADFPGMSDEVAGRRSLALRRGLCTMSDPRIRAERVAPPIGASSAGSN